MPSLLDFTKALLGFSAFAPPPITALNRSLEDPDVTRAREMAGGGLAPLPQTRLRWYLKDLEAAQHAADTGNLTPAAQLYRAMRRDGTISGLLSTRAAGLLRLPRSFTGAPDMVALMRARSNDQDLFDSTFPPSELRVFAEDLIMLNVAVAELVPVPGRKNPIFIRHEPEFLYYRWNENRWYFRSIAGPLPITPGDGRWVLGLAGGRISPWQFGAWIPCGNAFIEKSHAKLYRQNYGSKLANPARVIHAPPGAQEPERDGMLARMAAWGINTVVELPAGWEASLLESNGRGHQVWQEDESSANTDIKMAIAGQLVTSDGGTGFDKGDLFETIRSDIVQTDGSILAYILNTQAMPMLTALMIDLPTALADPGSVAWDTTPPQDRQREATLISTGASALAQLTASLQGYPFAVNVPELALRLGLPIAPGTPVAPPEPVAPSEEPPP